MGPFTAGDATNLVKNTGFFGLVPAISPESPFGKYLSFYGMKSCRVDRAGFYLSHGPKIFVLSIVPAVQRPVGTVVLLHGFLEHSGNLGETAGRLAERGYAVVLFDMPGHGLSEGDRGSVDDFRVYARALGDIAALAKSLYPGPRCFIGHSTGCSAALELLHEDPDIFSRVIFVAPLVHPSFWGWIRAAYVLGSGWLTSVPRAFFDNSGDREYAEYIAFMERSDPLQVRDVPVRWVKALVDWNERLLSYPVIPVCLTVIQGDADIALDWRENLKILSDRFRETDITMIDGGKHVLFHESEKRKERVFEKILEGLTNGNAR